MQEEKGKAADVGGRNSIYLLAVAGWLEVTQVEPPLLPYSVPVFARQSNADPKKG